MSYMEHLFLMFLDHTQRRSTVGRSLRRADHSSRGVLPTVLRRRMWSRNIKNRCSIYDISNLRVNGPSEPGRLRDVCVCQWVNCNWVVTQLQFQSAGRVPLFIVMSSNRARYGIMASPPSFSTSPEIPPGPVVLLFPIAPTLLLMILVWMVKSTPELAHCIYWVLPSLLNTEE